MSVARHISVTDHMSATGLMSVSGHIRVKGNMTGYIQKFIVLVPIEIVFVSLIAVCSQ